MLRRKTCCGLTWQFLPLLDDRARPDYWSPKKIGALMNPGSVDGMNDWRVVALLVDGIRLRENAVVIRAGFSYQAESFALGLRDKLDHFTHIRLQLLCRVPAGHGWQVGLKVWVNRRGNRKMSFQILESQGRVLTISARLKQRSREKPGRDRVQTRSAFRA